MLRRVGIEGYRSIRALDLEFGPLTVVTGGNGAGKTNLYRSLALFQSAAEGTLARTIALDGGMASILWAGAHGVPDAETIRLSIELDELRYDLRLGLPGPGDPALALDPVVREESVAVRFADRMPVMLHRKGPGVTARAPDGRWDPYPNTLLMAETALARLRDPRRFPELDALQRRLSAWRFYDGFRTDDASPMRQPQVAVCAPALDSDGANLAGALATALHLGTRGQAAGAAGEAPAETPIARAISAAFPGAVLEFAEAAGRYAVGLRTPEFRRAFAAHELSDGTLRYLAIVAALCAYRPPPFLALNEPEASLHRDLIDPLADTILRAARESQIVVVTHSEKLANRLGAAGARRIALEKDNGATVVASHQPMRPGP